MLDELLEVEELPELVSWLIRLSKSFHWITFLYALLVAAVPLSSASPSPSPPCPDFDFPCSCKADISVCIKSCTAALLVLEESVLEVAEVLDVPVVLDVLDALAVLVVLEVLEVLDVLLVPFSEIPNLIRHHSMHSLNRRLSHLLAVEVAYHLVDH